MDELQQNLPAYTPELWSIESTRDFGGAYRLMDCQGVTIAVFYQNPLDDTGTAKANALVCASVPRLISVGLSVLEAYGSWNRREEGGEDDLHYAVEQLRNVFSNMSSE